MIKKVVAKQNLQEHKNRSLQNDFAFWLSKSPEERIAAVEYLRKQYNGSTARLQRTARIIERPQS